MTVAGQSFIHLHDFILTFFLSRNFWQDDLDKKINELTNELECANRKCEVYRSNLFSVLKDIDDHKLQLSIKVQNIKISMKDSI